VCGRGGKVNETGIKEKSFLFFFGGEIKKETKKCGKESEGKDNSFCSPQHPLLYLTGRCDKESYVSVEGLKEKTERKKKRKERKKER
jgi:hypothetical protein